MELISDKMWSRCVYLTLGKHDAYRIVCSTKNAENILTHKWPVENAGAERRKAMDVCAEVMKGNLPADEARQAFILAAKEARLFIADTPRQFTFEMPTESTKKIGTSQHNKRRR
jgi:hypothetical protein